MTHRTGGHPVPLGATPDPTGTTFAVWSGGDAVDLALFDDDGRETRVPLTERTHGVWHGHLPGVGPGHRYGFRVAGPWDLSHGHRFNPAKLLLDPYARAVTGDLVANDAVLGHVPGHGSERDDRDSAPYVPRSVVVDSGYDWRGDSPPRVPWTDTVVYELHVPAFTQTHPDVPEPLRGSYAGLAHPAVLEHLRSLGVTTVELLPVHHFVSELALLRAGRVNRWGYNSLGWFAPHAGYAASGSRGEQVREFKDLVRAMHEAGLEVLLDVVYNHTAEGDAEGPTLAWRGLDNHAYYRLLGGRHYTDFTGCGNTFDLRHPRALQTVTDSLRYWVTEMHVDGFRFDLAPSLARGSDAFDAFGPFLAVLGQDPVLSTVKLVAEPWDVGPDGYQLGRFPPPWAEWNDRYRDAARIAWLADNAPGRAAGLRDLAYRLAGSSDVFSGGDRGPLATVNFLTAHDGFTLHDLVTYETKRNAPNGEGNRDGSDHNRGWGCGADGPTGDEAVRALRRKMMRNLLATLLVSTGVPMLTAGDETGRTQEGNNNAYSAPAGVPPPYPVDWAPAGWRVDLLEWIRALVRLRREHPVLRQSEFFEGRPAHRDGVKDLAWFGTDGQELAAEQWFDHDRRLLAAYLCAEPEGTSLLAVLNTGPAEVGFALPGLPWATSYDVLLDTMDEVPRPGPAVLAGQVLPVGPWSVQLLAIRP